MCARIHVIDVVKKFSQLRAYRRHLYYRHENNTKSLYYSIRVDEILPYVVQRVSITSLVSPTRRLTWRMIHDEVRVPPESNCKSFAEAK